MQRAKPMERDRETAQKAHSWCMLHRHRQQNRGGQGVGEKRFVGGQVPLEPPCPSPPLPNKPWARLVPDPPFAGLSMRGPHRRNGRISLIHHKNGKVLCPIRQ